MLFNFSKTKVLSDLQHEIDAEFTCQSLNTYNIYHFTITLK